MQKKSVFQAVIAISVISITVNKYLKALLASFILIKIALLSVRSLKAVK